MTFQLFESKKETSGGRMKVALIIICLALVSPYSFAQIGLFDQSSPSIKWEESISDRVKLIYPEEFRSESNYLEGLIEHYSHVVGQTYRIRTPRKFTLIVRPEVADPNGFVTLAPRRSEWYVSSMFFPSIGSTEWFQTLSIHEYRHVQQYDHFRYSTVKVMDYLFGDMGRFLAMFSGLQPWYFEGDAVWAETKYTDGGRGRSPRFLARLKALVLSDKIPTYDEFVNGSYRTRLPNHYIFGYVLISNGTKKFGDEFWRKVTRKVAIFPHPWRLVEAFEQVSGQNFQDFYKETMEGLREQWKEDQTSLKTAEYREESYPFYFQGEAFQVEYDLDHYHRIVKIAGNKKEVVADIPFSNDFNILSMSHGKAVYSQFLPDRRYGFKGSSDIILVDLKTGKKQQITKGKRLYNPRLNATAEKIIAVELQMAGNWQLVEMDLSGKILSSLNLDTEKPAEAFYLDDEHVVAIVIDQVGMKSIQKLNLRSAKREVLLPSSRNVIFNLFAEKDGNVFFEAQRNGKVEIMRISNSNQLSQCTNSKIGSFTPSTHNGVLFYSDVDTNGTKVKSLPISECKLIEKNSVIDFNYISEKSPSDNYNQFKPVSFPEQSSLRKNQTDQAHDEHGDFDKRLFIPHSWSFFGGRGSGVTLQTDNYLRTIGTSIAVGSETEGNGTYTLIDLNYKKYYPVINFHVDSQKREFDFNKSEVEREWKEHNVGVNVILPYLMKKDLYTFSTNFTTGISYKSVKNLEFDDVNVGERDQNFHNGRIALDVSLAKDVVARSILAPYEFRYSIIADKAQDVSNDSYDSFRIYQTALVQVPGFMDHHVISLKGNAERQRESNGSYRFLPGDIDPFGYVFSRGYQYKSVYEYKKASANYLFPLAYPDLAVGALYYLRRLYANAFFDMTKVDDIGANPTYNSYGLELNLESKIARILPLTIGLRGYYLDSDEKPGFDIFAGTQLGF
jgi:hypothetical protein